MYTAVVLTILQVIFLEGILSVDNAAVIGTLVMPLPNNRPVPWPSPLRRFGARVNRLLGPQRSAALKVGLLGAYVGRALMLAVATLVIQQPVLRLIGGFYLLFLAIDYLGAQEEEQITDAPRVRRRRRTNFWGVVLTIELVDLAFSLDNVVAVVSLSQEYWVVLTGVAIGIVLMRFAAGLFSRMIAWEPRLAIAGYLLIAAISIQLLLNEFWGIRFVPLHVAGATINADMEQFALSLLILVATLACARLPWLAPLSVIWRPALRICAGLRAAFHWLAWPFRALVHSVKGMASEQTG
ncbi:MAG: tellurium resistance protein TerC [Herpetosiphonaceae bacterium]|nr:tellurium resistance protein TerC [Herpetosiphonaceae bacterium]